MLVTKSSNGLCWGEGEDYAEQIPELVLQEIREGDLIKNIIGSPSANQRQEFMPDAEFPLVQNLKHSSIVIKWNLCQVPISLKVFDKELQGQNLSV